MPPAAATPPTCAIFAAWCAEAHLELFAVRRAHLELFDRWMEENGEMRSTVARRLSTLASFYLAHRLIKGGPGAMVATLELAGNHEHQIAALEPLWRSPSPATETVLVALGDTHPTRTVAKAARRAAFQRRSCNIR